MTAYVVCNLLRKLLRVRKKAVSGQTFNNSYIYLPFLIYPSNCEGYMRLVTHVALSLWLPFPCLQGKVSHFPEKEKQLWRQVGDGIDNDSTYTHRFLHCTVTYA
jgi:hypothetical protein